jgi:hypothetical protein
VGDAELVDMAVEGIGDATHVPSDAEAGCQAEAEKRAL